jgi:hypothetical protein
MRFNDDLHLITIRAVSAAALAAAAATQVVCGGEDHIRAFAVKVFALDEGGRLSAQVVSQ